MAALHLDCMPRHVQRWREQTVYLPFHNSSHPLSLFYLYHPRNARLPAHIISDLVPFVVRHVHDQRHLRALCECIAKAVLGSCNDASNVALESYSAKLVNTSVIAFDSLFELTDKIISSARTSKGLFVSWDLEK